VKIEDEEHNYTRKELKMSDQKLIEAMQQVLADTYAIYVKTHFYHWNVQGVQFFSLHEALEKQYKDLQESADEIAERIRALGVKASGSLKDFATRTKIEDGKADYDSKKMLEDLKKSHEQLSKTLQETIEIADDADDNVTEDFLVARLEYHQKTIWMLTASIA
jgi:starvation-inducible DNA-binding protein